jgi:integrase
MGFSCFYPYWRFCPIGVEPQNIRVYWGRIGVKLGVKFGAIVLIALMSKASAGVPQIKVSNGRLQIVFTYGGVRRYISAKNPDSKQNRIHCKMVAGIIENDQRAGYFDESLAKYKAFFSGVTAEKVAPDGDLTVREIWDSYVNFKRSQVSQSTIAKDFERISQHIGRFPAGELGDAVKIRDYLIRSVTPNTAKRVLTHLGAACNWAVKSNIVPSNPFLGMAADIRTPKKNGTADINPFSGEERDRIIQKLRDSRNPYAPLVEFMFRTGSRPSEAIGLQWKHISTDFKSIQFCQSITVSEDGLALKEGLKTQEERTFPCGAKLAAFLQSIAPKKKSPEQFIFQVKEGKFIDFNNFANKTWKTTLKTLEIEQRNPYQMRHSFITFCLEQGMDAKDVARLVGNSPEIIYRHYAGAKKDLIAPDI